MISIVNRIVQGLLITVFVAVLATVAFSQLTYAPNPANGTVTQVATAAPLTGGPITAAGTVSCASCAILATQTTTGGASLTPTVTPNAGSLFTVTNLTQPATFNPPTGTSVQGDTLLIRITGDATPRALTFTQGVTDGYRASTDLALPTTTVANKTMYLSFIRNTTAARWDFMAQLGNF
jgi:hypothetical protein